MRIFYFFVLVFLFYSNTLIAQEKYIPLNQFEKMINNEWKYFYNFMENKGFEYISTPEINNESNSNVRFEYKNRESIKFIQISYTVFNLESWTNKSTDLPNRRIVIETYDKNYINELKNQIKSNGYKLHRPGVYQKGNFTISDYFKKKLKNYTEYMIFIDVRY